MAIFSRALLVRPRLVTGERKEEREEGKGKTDILRLKSELKLSAYVSLWEFFNSNKLKK